MAWNGLQITRRGQDLNAKILLGQTELTITRVVVGDGVATGSVVNLTDLVHETLPMPITSSKRLPDGTALFSTLLSNEELAVGFFFREIGVFATDPDLGDILYSYDYYGTDPQWIPASGGATLIKAKYNLGMKISSAMDVVIKLDEDLQFMTRDELASLVGAQGGIAPLDAEGKVPLEHLPPIDAGGVKTVNGVEADEEGDVMLGAGDILLNDGQTVEGAIAGAGGVKSVNGDSREHAILNAMNINMVNGQSIENANIAGNSAGTTSALTLAGPGFLLKDMARCILRLSSGCAANATLNVQGTGAIPIYETPTARITAKDADVMLSMIYVASGNRWLCLSIIATPPAGAEYTSAGTHSYKVPTGITQLKVLLVGGGGGGGNGTNGAVGASDGRSWNERGGSYSDDTDWYTDYSISVYRGGAGGNGGGGGGAGTVIEQTITVTPGETLTIVVPNGGNAQSAGGTATVSRGSTTLVSASGGSGANGANGGNGGNTSCGTSGGGGNAGYPGSTGWGIASGDTNNGFFLPTGYTSYPWMANPPQLPRGSSSGGGSSTAGGAGTAGAQTSTNTNYTSTFRGGGIGGEAQAHIAPPLSNRGYSWGVSIPTPQSGQTYLISGAYGGGGGAGANGYGLAVNGSTPSSSGSVGRGGAGGIGYGSGGGGGGGGGGAQLRMAVAANGTLTINTAYAAATNGVAGGAGTRGYCLISL